MEKIAIRYQRVSDAKHFYEILTSHSFAYFPVEIDSLDDERAFLKKTAEKRRTNFEHNFTILYEGEVAGGIGLKINQHYSYVGEIGYFLAEEYQGRGIATRAVKLVEHRAFGDIGLKRIEAVVMPKNMASIRVLVKNRYKEEGLMRKRVLIKNRYRDALLLAKTR